MVFSLFKANPLKKLQKEHESLLSEAFEAQRNGNVRLYSTLTADAEAVREKIETLKAEAAVLCCLSSPRFLSATEDALR